MVNDPDRLAPAAISLADADLNLATNPIFRALAVLSPWSDLRCKNGVYRLDGAVVRIPELVARANRRLAAEGAPLIHYPGVRSVNDRRGP
jgi:hypothetical protein